MSDDQEQSGLSDEAAGDAHEGNDTATVAVHHDLAEWRGLPLHDENGERIGKLEEVYFDIETDEPQFGTVKEGLFGRHLTFVPLIGATVSPDSLQVATTAAEVKGAPNIALEGDGLTAEDESVLYHYYRLNYTPSDRESEEAADPPLTEWFGEVDSRPLLDTSG